MEIRAPYGRIASMTTFKGPDSHIHNIARGFLVRGDDVILCHVKDAKWYFLPGGHIEDGESAKAALERELHEEIGEGDYKISSFVGVCENVFPLDENVSQHEINIILKVDVPAGFEAGTKENHIEFVTVAQKDLGNYKILPAPLKEGLLEWLKDRKPFLKEF